MESAQEFEHLLEQLGWASPTYLSKKWKINRKTVYNWKESGPPVYVLDYLRQTVRLKEGYERLGL